MSKNKPVIVCDIDGTISDSTKRNHLAQQKKWDEFYALSVEDPPKIDVIDRVIRKAIWGDYTLVFITGRDENQRRITLEWLSKYITLPFSLLMRTVSDYRPAAEVKTELAKSLNAEIVAWFDDDPTCIIAANKELKVPWTFLIDSK